MNSSVANFQRKSEHPNESPLERLRLACLPLFADGVIVKVRVPDRVIEDRRIRSGPSNRELSMHWRSVRLGEEPSLNVVKPETLAEIVELSRGLHSSL